MKESHEYLVPDYYPAFRCKMGECRTPCCEGWPISISLEDYYRLSSAECSQEMRDKLDRGVRVKLHPTPDAYAEITPRYDGACPFHRPDGLCAIHAELGEEALSYVCRLYPRGVRLDGCCECSCANSCERVLEMLFSRDEPITFIRQNLTFSVPGQGMRSHYFETLGREEELRLWLIRQLQQQMLPMPQRILAMGHALWALEDALNTRDAVQVDRLLQGQRRVPPLQPTELTQGHLDFGLTIAKGMIRLLDERSDSIRTYGEAALTVFDDSFDRYAVARAHFESTFPKWDVWFEHMLVNHMYFSRFPFQDRPLPLWDEFIALCAVYALLRFLCIGWMADKDDLSSLVDVCAAAFRLVDHTSFDRYAAELFKDLGAEEKLQDLLAL